MVLVIGEINYFLKISVSYGKEGNKNNETKKQNIYYIRMYHINSLSTVGIVVHEIFSSSTSQEEVIKTENRLFN